MAKGATPKPGKMAKQAKLPEGLKRFMDKKKKKKPANPNLRPGTKQTEKNRRKQMEKKLDLCCLTIPYRL